MARAKLVFDITVVFGALIGVLDHQLDGCAGRHPLKHTRKDAHLISLTPLRGVFVLAGFALVQPMLNHRRIDGHTGRAPIDSRTQGRPMAFAPSGHTEKMAKAVNRHANAPVTGEH